MLGWDHQAGCFGISLFSFRGFSTRGCFLLRLPWSPLRGCWVFRLWILGLAVSLVSVTVGFRAPSLPDEEGIIVWFVGCDSRGLDVIPTVAKTLLLGRTTRPLGFWSGRLGCGDALPAALGRLLSKSRHRLLPLNTATVARRVVPPTVTARRLAPRGRAATGAVGAPTSDAK